MSKPKPRNGKSLNLFDQRFLRMGFVNVSPLQGLREAVENSRQAGSTKIDVFFSKPGVLVIADDGIGMNAKELIRLLDLGVTTQGAENFGVGIKYAIFMPGITLVKVISAKRDQKAAVYNQVEICEVAEKDHATGNAGLAEYEEGKLFKEVSAPYRGNYSTVVEIHGIDVTPEKVIKYLNQRYIEPGPAVIRVLEEGTPQGKDSTWRTISGVKAQIARVCQKSGYHEYETCTLHWGIRESQSSRTFRTQVGDDEWRAPPLTLGAKNETFEETSLGHSQKLSNWGIYAGDREIILVIEAKGENVQYSIERDRITGWSADEAQEEIHRVGLPSTLEAFMRAFEAEYFEPDSEEVNTKVAEILKSFGQELVGLGRKNPGSSRKPPGPRNSNPEAPEPLSDEEKERRRLRRIPDHRFVAREVMGDRRIQLSPGPRLLINKDAPEIVKVLSSAKSQKAKDDVRTRIVVGIKVNWLMLVNQYGTEPTQEALDALFNGAALMEWMKKKG